MPVRRLARLLVSFVVVALFALAPAAHAGTKPYSVVLSTSSGIPPSPATIPAGQTSTILATYTNNTATQQLGSSDLAAPVGLTLVRASVPAPGTVTVSSNTARIRNLSLAPGRSVTVALDVAAPPSCTTSRLTWPTPSTKQSNDFNGPPGNDMTFQPPPASDLRTIVTGTTCLLRFVNAPANAGAGMTITSRPFDTAGPSVSVEVVDPGGNRVTSSSAPVTMAIEANPGSGTLSGTTTVNAASGLATFTNPSITRAGVGYTLTASGPSLTPVTSGAFTIEDPVYGVVTTNADGGTPSTLPAGDAVQLRFVVSTLKGGRTLRSADIVLPTGFTATSASVPSPGTATISGSTVQLRNLALPRGADVTATVTLRVPCTAGSVDWSTTAKSTSDFSGVADFTLDATRTTFPTALTGGCSLRFSSQPTDARSGQVITNTPITPTGPPVAVEVLGTSGQRVTWSTAPITASLAAGPAATLSGTTTVAAGSGVATFSLSIATIGNGYQLGAESAGITGATSSAFSISQTATACTEDVNCSATIPLPSGGKSNVLVTAFGNPSPDVGYLTTSTNFGGPLDCDGYTELVSDVVAVTYVGNAREKKVVATVDKAVMNAVSDNGAAKLEVCFGSPEPFDTEDGKPRLAENQAYVPGPYPRPEYKGLLPDCGKAAVAPDGTPVASAGPPCVTARNKTNAGDAVIESRWPSGLGDPRSRY